MSSIRLTATRYIWVAFVFVIGVSFSDVVIYGNSPGLGHVIIAAILASGAMLSTGFVWNWGTIKMDDRNEETGKSKRAGSRNLEKVLKRLSESDRTALREYLNADEEEGYMLTTDGEIIQRR